MNTLKLLSLSLLSLSVSILPLTLKAQSKEKAKLEAAAEVLHDFGKMRESIPHELLAMSEGIIIVPKLINAGFVIGGKRGRGIAMVKNANGTWSNPVFVTITGGSFGFQIGVQAVDLVLVFKHRGTLLNMHKGSFTLGGDISATAGPVGRSSTAGTDYKLEAEVYSYSRSKGLFAGITVNGAAIDVDKKADVAFYGEKESTWTIFTERSSRSDEVRDLKATLTGLYN